MSVSFLNDSPSFAQDEIADMARVVDNVCEVLEIPSEDTPALKSIAERVLDHAKRGVRDPSELTERVVNEMRASLRLINPDVL